MIVRLSRIIFLAGALAYAVFAPPSCGRAAEPLIKERIDWPVFLARHDLLWKQIPRGWSEAPFLGNGRLALCMYQEPGKNAIRFALDRTDVFDRRDTSWGWTAYSRARYHVGDFQLHPVGKITAVDLRQDLWNAELRGSIITDQGKLELRAIVHATQPLFVIEVTRTKGEKDASWTWHPYKAETTRNGIVRTPADAKKYQETYGNPSKIWEPNPSPELTRAGEMRLCVQKLLAGGGYTTAWQEVESKLTAATTNSAPSAKDPGGGKSHRTLLCSIAMSYPELTSPDEAKSVVKHAAAGDFNLLVTEHRDWWHSYYPASFVSFPDTRVEGFYWITMYKYACAARADTGVIDTHGPWFQNTGWPYITFDLNTQVSYWGLQPSNRLELSESLGRNMQEHAQNLIQNAPKQFQYDSAAIGVAAQQDLQAAVDDDRRYERYFGGLPWLCHNEWLQYRYSMDDEILRNRLFPLLRRAMNLYLHYVEEGDDGKLHLAAMFSPEYSTPDKRSTFRDTSHDLALFRWGCTTLLTSCERLKIDDPLIPRWRDVVKRLADYPQDETGLMIGKDTPLIGTHRHLAHLMAIHPLYLVNWEQPKRRDMIERSLRHSAPATFKGDFLNFTAAWAACMYASMGRGDDAYRLSTMCIDTLWPNTMFAFSGQNIETPLIAIVPLHDMLLQSWGDRIRVFNAAPSAWPDLTFHNLRAEGAFLVSAKRKDGKTQWVRLKSLAGEPCRLQTDMAEPLSIAAGPKDVSLRRVGTGLYKIGLSKNQEIVIAGARSDASALLIEPLPQQSQAKRWGLPEPSVKQ
jgi:alpha-L-fucosidase 2